MDSTAMPGPPPHAAKPKGACSPASRRPAGPRVIGPAELATLRRLVGDGVSVIEAARTFKIGRSTTYAALAES
ncbi:hypothetical protein [Nonomuraea longicatena]|uniref:Resolvase HTH domain-containing protein n=1 Tax=Nonomuraea longicatena TaxID=83682 RepID=A0ABN1RCB1_9ACTN